MLNQPITDDKKIPLWLYVLVLSLGVFAIQIILLFRHGPVVYEKSERWKAALSMVPFWTGVAAMEVGMFTSARKINPGFARKLNLAIAFVTAAGMSAVFVAITWFILFH
jgi:hypothetical protein